MTCWAIIPVKESGAGKSRLAGVLGQDERAGLVAAMLARVVGAAQASREISRVLLVGPSRHGLPETIPLLADPGQGLNAAVASALAEVADPGPVGQKSSGQSPGRVIVIAADLPGVTVQELDLLALAPEGTMAIAPDRHGVGTNALSLPLPAGREFAFAFGTDSFARHSREAERLDLRVETVISQGLERDIDEPADLPDAQAALDSQQPSK